MSLPATETVNPGEDLVGTTIAERFRLDAVVGDGAMGVVYRARHLGLKKDVALKLLHRELTANREMVERFDREAASASRLDHPNCVRIMDYGATQDRRSYLVMELLEGEELSRRLPGPLPPFAVVQLMQQVLDALEHAHGHGIVHRDIKPENIFITAGPEGEVVKILDFGIAKIQRGEGSSPLTQVGMVFGTPHYMSPEQAKASTVDARTDLYSLGVVMYEALTGHVPFEEEDPGKVLRAHLRDDPPPMPESVPAPLRRFVSRLLQKAPGDRFPDAAAARAALKRASIGSGPVANRTGATVVAVPPPKQLPRPAALDDADVSAAVPPPPPPAPQGAVATPPPAPPPVVASEDAVPRPMPPAAASPATPRPAWHNYVYVAGGLAFAGIVFVATSGDSTPTDDAKTEESGQAGDAPAAADSAAEPAAAPAAEDVIIVDETSPQAELEASVVAVDALIDAKEYKSGQIALEPLLERYPDNAELHWRMGQILVAGGAKKNGPEAFEHYRRAVELEPDLLVDDDFHAQLFKLVDDPRMREDAVPLAIALLGEDGTERLLAWVNVQKEPLAWSARHDALDHLRAGGRAKEVNEPLQVALDLWQASAADDPCEAYGAALAVARDKPDSYLWGSIAQSPIPMTGDGDDAEFCAGLGQERDELVEVYETRYAGLTPTVPAAFGKRSAPPKTTQPSSNRRRRNRRRR